VERPRRVGIGHHSVARLVVSFATALVGGVIIFLAVYNIWESGNGHPPATACVDPGPLVSDLHYFERRVNAQVNCVVLFDDTAQTWSQWANPWFVSNAPGNENWTRFARRSGNRVVLTVDLFPSQLNSSDWRAAGARGAYDRYDRRLAANLVRGGMGHAIIRLAHEANGTWYADNIGDNATQMREWRQFWRRTVLAMRSVKGAHFSFDWCVNSGVRAIPLADYYPGDDVVDSIGVDVYDSGIPHGVSGWAYQYKRPEGVRTVVRFARAHHKPIAIPEWGLQPSSQNGRGVDPGFTRGIIALVDHDDVAFESYFFHQGGRAALLADPESLRLYRDDLLR
jgi:hypothetical protein